jgi:hypothetical protein
VKSVTFPFKGMGAKGVGINLVVGALYGNVGCFALFWWCGLLGLFEPICNGCLLLCLDFHERSL